MSAIQRERHAVAVSVGWRGSNTTGGALVLVAFRDVTGLVFFRGISDDRSVGAYHTTRAVIVSSRSVEIIVARGSLRSSRRRARALGSGGHRSPRSSQRVLGSVLRQWLGPVVSHCSLEAACAERPRPKAPIVPDAPRHTGRIAAQPRGARLLLA